MRTFAYLCLSTFLFTAACGGGDDAMIGDDVLEPDAETEPMIDAGLEPDADNSCTTDAACVGHIAGDTLCMGSSVVTCSANGDCLDATSVACTVGDMCVDDGTPACETPAGDGDTCATALAITADTTFSGADFAADYADDLDLTDASCDDGDPESTSSEAVFSVALIAGQRVTVTNSGGMDSVMAVQQTCGAASACLVAGDDPDSITYTATAATTVFVSIGSYELVPTPADYDIAFDLSACGDGVIDADFEACDDDDPDSGDGCSSTCQFEFGFDCDDAEPTVCTALPDLGTHAGGATITGTSATALAAGASVFYTVTFTVPVRVNGTLTATAGNPDWFAHTPLFSPYGEAETGNEIIGDTFERYFTAGKYIFEVYASTALTAGYNLSLTTVAPVHTDLGTFAPAAAITPVTDPDGLAPGASDYFTITFSAPVELSATLVSGTGDMDLYWWTAGDLVFVSSDLGDETVSGEPLPAGTYFIRTNAYFADPAVDTYTLSMTTTAAP